jgi:hypothetical protein
MKATLFLLLAALSTLLPFSARSQTVVTFDDLSETGSGAWLSGYAGLTWNNILCNNAILFTNVLPHLEPGAPTNGLCGDFYGMVSASNVVVMGPNSEIDSTGTNFNFLSAYLTGLWNSNLNIEVEGFNGAKEIYDTIVIVIATNATLFTFDYFNIDRLYFNSYGGEEAFPGATDSGFVMDNFMFESIPEPSSLLLTILGVLMLWAIGKRRAT